ncbi:AraC family transcriptional regulator [Maricurvus nonylphenolicus]|uniref:AraC family transcriptional regulator n=1 Tax=Maricurvus nonylphenolicus TaxID=1008307 RepID=UPI0036F3482B
MQETEDTKFSSLHAHVLLDFLAEEGHLQTSEISEFTKQFTNARDNTIDSTIAYRDFKHLIAIALQHIPNPELGLQFGNRINITGLSELGLASLASSRPIEVLQLIQEFGCIINPALTIDYSQKNNQLHVAIVEALPWDGTGTFMIDTFLAIVSSGLQALNAVPQTHIHYHLKHITPANHSIYQRHLYGHVTASQEGNEIILSLRAGDIKTGFNNPSAVKFTTTVLEKQRGSLQHLSNSLSKQVKVILEEDIESPPNMENLAQTFNLSAKSFERHLKKEGTSYQQLLTQVRKKIAVNLLTSSNVSIIDIATRLGYKDSSNFSKAFRDWTNQSPSNFRKSNRQ